MTKVEPKAIRFLRPTEMRIKAAKIGITHQIAVAHLHAYALATCLNSLRRFLPQKRITVEHAIFW